MTIALFAKKPLLTRLNRAIKAMFANGEQGVWYDPSDLTTLFQDSAGTTPVTAVEQPVGLMLDKSKGLVLGPEVLTNGDFSGGSTGWAAPVAGAAITSGQLAFDGVTSITSGTVIMRTTGTQTVTAGRLYSVTYTLTGNVTLPISVGLSNVLGISRTAAGTYTDLLLANVTGDFVTVWARASAGARTGGLDNISVKEITGNHATQATSGNRPALSARVNLLTKTEQFGDTAWTALKSAGASVTENNRTAPNGTLTADTVTFAASDDYLYQAIASYPAITGNSVTLKYYSQVTSRLVVFGGGSPAGTDVHSFVAADGGWYLHTTTRTFTVTTSASALQVLPSGSIVGAGSYGLWGIDLRPTDQSNTLIPTYQRVNTSTDYDTAGFPLYLKFNGTSSSMATNSINFTATDKMAVWAGVRKLSDAGNQMLIELSTGSGTGRFYLTGALSSAAKYQVQVYGAGGTGITADYTPFVSPVSNVISTALDAGSTSTSTAIAAKINGTANSGSVSGLNVAATFGNHSLYLGARAGSSLFGNFNLHCLIARGAKSSASQISSAEAWANQKTKAY